MPGAQGHSQRDNAAQGQSTRSASLTQRVIGELGRQAYTIMRRSSLKAVRNNGGQVNLLTATERTVLYWSTLREADIAAISDDLIHVGALSKALRGRGPDADNARQDYKALLSAYDSALSKLPNFVGTVLRGLTINGDELHEFLASHSEGSEVRYDFFTHATMKDILPDEYSGNVELVIASHYGKRISHWSAYPDEDEVAFRHGTAYQVADDFFEDDVYIIFLSESKEEKHE